MKTPRVILFCAIFSLLPPLLAAQPATENPYVEGSLPRTLAVGADLSAAKIRMQCEFQPGMAPEYTYQINGEPLRFTPVAGHSADGWMEAAIPPKLLASLKGLSPTPPVAGRERLVFRGRQLVREQEPNLVELFNTHHFALDVAADPATAPSGPSIDSGRSLMIVDLSVVNDARASGLAAWSFGGIMTRLARQNNHPDPVKMTRDWLLTWATNQTVAGGDAAAARADGINRVLTSWPKDAAGNLDLARAPFRLCAIVNRLDLRPKPTPAREGEAGEGRFVFCLIDPVTQEPFRGGVAFLAIFEFGVRFNTLDEVREYGRQWAALSGLNFGSAFNNQLQALTDRFTELNQLRTNERHLAPEWELREFRLQPGAGLRLEDVKRNAANRYASFKGATPASLTRLHDWVNANRAAILADDFTVPPDFAGQPFAGAAAAVPQPTSHWRLDQPPMDNEVVHHLSLQSCNGCHGGEAHTGSGAKTRFVHVTERGLQEKAGLSDFLTGAGMPMSDPRQAGVPREFNDLLRRAQDLEGLIAPNPLNELLRQPLNFVH